MNTPHSNVRPDSSTHRRKRRWVAGLCAGLLTMSVLAAPPAFAASGPYVIDGVVPDANIDINMDDDEGNVQELGPLNSNTTKIGVIHNDAVPTLGTTNPNAQVDLRQAWLEIQRYEGKDWLYFAWERDKATGSGFIAYEFMRNAAPASCTYEASTDAQLIAGCNPWANRQGGAPAAGGNPAVPGDFMILWDQQGGGLDLALRVWSGTAPNLVLGPPVALNLTVSEAAISEDGFFGEAAVNLTDTIFGGALQCLSFANTIPSTVTGNSDTADYKDTILQTIPPISNCSTTTVTTPQTAAGAVITADGVSIGTGVVAVRDSAYITLTGGTGTPGGTVAFSLCKVDSPATCGSGGTTVGSTTVTAAAYPFTVVSPTAYVTSVGRYCWRAVYDDGNATNGISGSSDSSATECFTVTPKTPTLATTAGADVLLGNAVTDTANLSALATDPATPVIQLTNTPGPAAGGTITFKLFGPGGTCTGVPLYTSPTVTVSGNGAYGTPAPQYVPTATGTYHWVAVYSGSTNNNGTTHNAACTDSNEDVDVTSVASSLTSAQRWVPNDSVTITVPAGSGALAGNVDFELFTNGTCSGTAVYTLLNVAVTAAQPTASSANTTAYLATGNFSWRVNYDSTNDAQRDIPATCHETSALTVTNGGTVSSP